MRIAVTALLALLLAVATAHAKIDSDFYSYQSIESRVAEKGRAQEGKYLSHHCEMALQLALKPEVAMAIQSTAQEIFHRFPPERFIVIGIGGSPGALIANLQNQTENYAFNLPLSLPVFQGGPQRYIPKEYEAALFIHFKRFLPSEKLSAGKAFVLIDYAVTGETLRNSAAAIISFLAGANGSTEVRRLFIVGELGSLFASVEPEETLVINSTLAGLFSKEALKSLSEYPSYVPGYTDSQSLRQNPAYRDYRLQLDH